MDNTLARFALAAALAAMAGMAVAFAGSAVASSAVASQDTPRQDPPRADVPIPAKKPSPPSEEGTPTVTIRSSDNGDRVEEYREGGKVYMVRIVPVRGKPYYLYDDDRNGRLDRSDADRHTIAPVYWTIYEWD